MKELQLLKNKAVLIEGKKIKLTNGELALMALMKKKIESNEVVMFDEIIEIYTKYVRLRNNSHWIEYDETNRAKQWFKVSLGNLVLKTKLVVIPVIEL